MFKLLGFKFSFIASINELIIFLKMQTKIILKNYKISVILKFSINGKKLHYCS